MSQKVIALKTYRDLICVKTLSFKDFQLYSIIIEIELRFSKIRFLSIFSRRQLLVSADEIFLTNIRDSGRNGISFDVYIRSGNNGVLSMQTVYNAVQVS